MKSTRNLKNSDWKLKHKRMNLCLREKNGSTNYKRQWRNCEWMSEVQSWGRKYLRSIQTSLKSTQHLYHRLCHFWLNLRPRQSRWMKWIRNLGFWSSLWRTINLRLIKPLKSIRTRNKPLLVKSSKNEWRRLKETFLIGRVFFMKLETKPHPRL